MVTKPKPMKKYQNPDVLEELYYEQEMTTTEIADRFGVSQATISNWLNKHNISRQKNYQTPDVLEELYCEQKMTMEEIADRFGVSQPTINRWINKHNISRQEEYKDPEILNELYCEKKMSTIEIADKLGVSQSTISKWVNKHNIQTRKSNDEKPPYYGDTGDGYKTWIHRDGEKMQQVLAHRLLAVSEFGFDAVCGMDVHHKNGCRFDNRPENIELLTPSEHAKLHRKKEAQTHAENSKIF